MYAVFLSARILPGVFQMKGVYQVRTIVINSVPAGYGDTGLAVDAFVNPSAQRKSVVNRVKYTFFYSYPKEINITYPAIQYKPGEPSSSAVRQQLKSKGLYGSLVPF